MPGTAYEDPDNEHVDTPAHCLECEGNGWIDDPLDGGTTTCPVCDGAGITSN